MVAQVVDVIEVAGHRQHPDRTAQPMQAGLGRAGEPPEPRNGEGSRDRYGHADRGGDGSCLAGRT